MAPEDNIMTNRWQDLYFYKEKKKHWKCFCIEQNYHWTRIFTEMYSYIWIWDIWPNSGWTGYLMGMYCFIKQFNHMIKKLNFTKWHIITKNKFPPHSSPLPLIIQISFTFFNAWSFFTKEMFCINQIPQKQFGPVLSQYVNLLFGRIK